MEFILSLNPRFVDYKGDNDAKRFHRNVTFGERECNLAGRKCTKQRTSLYNKKAENDGRRI